MSPDLGERGEIKAWGVTYQRDDRMVSRSHRYSDSLTPGTQS
jgi:hypothetical protein